MKGICDSHQMHSCDNRVKQKKAFKAKVVAGAPARVLDKSGQCQHCCVTLWEPDERYSSGAAEKAVLRHVTETVMQRQHIVFLPSGVCGYGQKQDSNFGFRLRKDQISGNTKGK